MDHPAGRELTLTAERANAQLAVCLLEQKASEHPAAARRTTIGAALENSRAAGACASRCMRSRSSAACLGEAAASAFLLLYKPVGTDALRRQVELLCARGQEPAECDPDEWVNPT